MRFIFIAIVSLFIFTIHAAEFSLLNNNPFSNAFDNWSQAKTNAELSEYFVNDVFKFLQAENPQCPPNILKQYLNARFGLEPASVDIAAMPQNEIHAEALRIFQLSKMPSKKIEADQLLSKLIARAPENSLTKEELCLFQLELGWAIDANDIAARRANYSKAMINFLKNTQCNGRPVVQLLFNRMDSCSELSWAELEKALAYLPNTDPWLKAMLQARVAWDRAWAYRGTDTWNKISEQNKNEFNRESINAQQHLFRAININAQWLNPHIQLINIYMTTGDSAKMIRHFKAIVRILPETVSAFNKISWGLLPRWGGSHFSIAQLAAAAMACPKRDSQVPALGYGCLALIAWDYPDMRWKKIYLLPEIQASSDRIFNELQIRTANTADYDFYLRLKILNLAATLRYAEALERLNEYGGADKFRKSKHKQRRRNLDKWPGTPWYNDVARQIELFTGADGQLLQKMERMFLSGKTNDAAKLLFEYVKKSDLSPENRDFLLDLAASWQLEAGGSSYCGMDNNYKSAFVVACELNNFELAQDMLNQNYDFRKYELYPGEAIYQAVSNKCDDRFIELLKKFGSSLSDPNPERSGRTVLHIAAFQKSAKILSGLIENGSEVNARDNNGHTPLHIAGSIGNIEAMQILLKNGADPNAQDNDGDTVMIYMPHLELSAEVYDVMFNQRKTNLNMPNHAGNTLLHNMMQYNSPAQLVEKTIKKGAKVNVINKAELSPLDIARKQNNQELITLLKKHHAKDGATIKKEQAVWWRMVLAADWFKWCAGVTAGLLILTIALYKRAKRR